MRLSIFPLPIFLLPTGITRLKIFEPRYKRLVKKATEDQGFVITIFKPKSLVSSSMYGVWVDIIDFHTFDDGLLYIDVLAKKLVKLSSFTIEYDDLCIADVNSIEHWSLFEPNILSPPYCHSLSVALEKIVNANPEVKSLYPTPDFDNIYWVCARFIELLPISIELKQQFYSYQSFEDCLNFLHTVINGKD